MRDTVIHTLPTPPLGHPRYPPWLATPQPEDSGHQAGLSVSRTGPSTALHLLPTGWSYRLQKPPRDPRPRGLDRSTSGELWSASSGDQELHIGEGERVADTCTPGWPRSAAWVGTRARGLLDPLTVLRKPGEVGGFRAGVPPSILRHAVPSASNDPSQRAT